MSEKLWTRDNLAKWMFKVYDSVDEEEAKKYLGLDPDEDITEAIPEEYLDNCAYFLIAKDWAYKELADYGYDFVWFMADGDHYLGQTMGDRMYDVTDEVLDCVYRAVESGKYEDEYKKHLGESKKSFGKMNEAEEKKAAKRIKQVDLGYWWSSADCRAAGLPGGSLTGYIRYLNDHDEYFKMDDVVKAGFTEDGVVVQLKDGILVELVEGGCGFRVYGMVIDRNKDLWNYYDIFGPVRRD